jgi:hypothetical protein
MINIAPGCPHVHQEGGVACEGQRGGRHERPLDAVGSVVFEDADHRPGRVALRLGIPGDTVHKTLDSFGAAEPTKAIFDEFRQAEIDGFQNGLRHL